jgi:hypothetical protein
MTGRCRELFLRAEYEEIKAKSNSVEECTSVVNEARDN